MLSARSHSLFSYILMLRGGSTATFMITRRKERKTIQKSIGGKKGRWGRTSGEINIAIENTNSNFKERCVGMNSVSPC